MRIAIIVITLCISKLMFAQSTVAQSNYYVCPPCNSTCDDAVYGKSGVCDHCAMELIKKEAVETPKDNGKKRIAFYLQDGVEVLDFAGPMEVFSYAGFEVFTVSKTKDVIQSQGILNIQPDYAISDAPKADILAFFGGNASSASQDQEVIDWVKQQTDIDYYFSVCTGAFILAEAGILNNKTATTFHAALNDLEKNYPAINVLKDTRYVDNGTVITTAGISAGIDGALHLVAKIKGFNNARKVAYNIEYDKWTPGEGRLLIAENPYDYFKKVDNLKDFVGTYEFKDNQKVVIAYSERENSIYAILDEQNYPLFYLTDNSFQSIDGQHITFERDARNTVTGYRSDEDTSILYKKLK